MDEFVVGNKIMEEVNKLKYCIGGGLSYHLPIFLQIENEKYNPMFSFTYNHTLLYKEYFINLATHNQHKSEANLGESTMFQFVINLKNKNKNCGRMGKKYISRIFK